MTGRINEQTNQNSRLSENLDFSSAFITNNLHGIWRIELKHPVATILPENEQIRQIKQFGFLAQCNDALAVRYGHESIDEMMRFSGDNFPADLLGDERLRDFVQSDYRLNEFVGGKTGAAGKFSLVSSDVFGIVEDKRLTQIWGMQREMNAPEAVVANSGLTKLSSVSADLHRAVVDSMPAHIAILDGEGKIVSVNEAWKRFAGENDGAAASSVGTNYLNACLRGEDEPNETARQSRDGIREVLNGERKVFSLEYPCHAPSGQERWFLLHVTPLEEGGAVVSHLNITKRKLAEQKLEETVQQLKKVYAEAEAVNHLKDEFLATVSHELRTPLNAMLGWAKLLRAGNLDDKAAQQGLETIERNTLVQARLIEDLLDVSRIINGKLRLDAHPIKLPKLVAAAIEPLQPTATAKNIEIEFSSEIGDAPVFADPRRIQQIMWNLLSNAIKFTPRGGHIGVNVRQVESSVEIAVSDDGMGIKPNFLPHLFERFRQADGSTTRQHGGLGLGLAIVRHLVELHGGQVEAESAGEGAGATFSIRLPLMGLQLDSVTDIEKIVTKDNNALNEDSMKAIKLEGVNLLIVDDDRDNLELLTLLFETLGAQVTTASSATEAIIKFQNAPMTDLLISDIGMPEHDGYELIQEIRSLPSEEGGEVPAIALTAYAKNEDRLLALSKGFQRHIKKPVEPSDLAKQVTELLEQKHRLH